MSFRHRCDHSSRLIRWCIVCCTFAHVAAWANWSDHGKTFTVGHYNILADYVANNRNPWFLLPLNLTSDQRHAILAKYYERDSSDMYRYTFSDGYGGLLSEEQIEAVRAADAVFRWPARYPLLKMVVRDLDADILSLVEMDHFEDFRTDLWPEYDAAFVRRPRARSVDGCSLFWRRERFRALGRQLNVTFEDWEPGRAEVHRQDRVMLAVALEDLTDGAIIVAASLHLMRNPEDEAKDPVRMLEVSQMMRSLSCFVAEVGAMGLVIMGDFNAVPESWTHLFLLHGWQDCPSSEKGMRDAFAEVEWGGAFAGSRDAACTTRTHARCLWVDYVFYSGRSLELASAVEVERCPVAAIPDALRPSDHLPLRAKLRRSAAAPSALAVDARSRLDASRASCDASPGSSPS